MPPGSLPADRVRPGLALLLEAFKIAKETEQEPWDFAVDLGDLREAGLSVNHLRGLLASGHIKHGLDHFPGAGERRFIQQINWLTFRPNSCFILSPAGVDYALGLTLLAPKPDRGGDATNGTPSPRPHWDATTRLLHFDGELIKQFYRTAPLQRAVLDEFESRGWCGRIEVSPLLLGASKPKDRLHELINSLNDNHLKPRMHFSSDGSGHGVCWQPVAEPRRKAARAPKRTHRRRAKKRSSKR